MAEAIAAFLAGRVGTSRPTIHAIGRDGYTICGYAAPTTVGMWSGGRGSCRDCASKIERLAEPRRPPLASWEKPCGDATRDADGDIEETCRLVAGHPGTHAGWPPLEWPREADHG
jgi:hypothetical protein